MFCEKIKIPGLPGEGTVTDGSVDWYEMDWENVDNGMTEEQMPRNIDKPCTAQDPCTDNSPVQTDDETYEIVQKYYCVLFDADNTLLDFDAAENKALADTLREYGIEPDAETVQTYRTINEELWRQLEKGQIRRDKLMGERFTRFLKAVNAAGNGVEMNKFYLDQLSTHPDLTSPNVLDVLRELSEVATLAVVTNGFDRVQSRRVRESGILDFVEDVFVSEKMDSEKPNRKIFDAALRALGVENREHVLMVGDSLSSDVQGGVNAGLDTCWYNPNHAENPGKVVPTYEISSLEELYPLVMEPEELANVGLKNRRHQL